MASRAKVPCPAVRKLLIPVYRRSLIVFPATSSRGTFSLTEMLRSMSREFFVRGYRLGAGMLRRICSARRNLVGSGMIGGGGSRPSALWSIHGSPYAVGPGEVASRTRSRERPLGLPQGSLRMDICPEPLDAMGSIFMFVVVQFPIADARRFVQVPQTYLLRPSWKVPQVGVVSEYVWGFGRLVHRTAEVDPAWSDEAFYVLAASAVRLPELVQRQVQLASRATPASITCRFRRLFHDGVCVARVEVGFHVRLSPPATRPLDAEAAVGHLLALPSTVTETGRPTRNHQLAFQGPRLAARYRDASTPRSLRGIPALVAAGNPVVLVDNTDDVSVNLPDRLEDASAATSGRIRLGFALTQFGGAGIPTWYLGPNAEANADSDMRRKLRICLLRLHAEEEALDRIVSWVDGGSLAYVAGSDAAERLDAYINRATQLLERQLNFGLPSSALRDAYDAVTKVNRHDVSAQRRAAFDGMRLQIRRKAELFIARRDAVRTEITIKGDYVNEKINVHAHDIKGSQIGSHNIQTIIDSLNEFAAAHGKEDSLLDQMKIISESVATLVTELQGKEPNAAKEVTETFQSFAEESAKGAPKAGTLRVLGRALVEAGRKVADVAAPLAGAVAAVMQIFGIPPL
jgi:hypothetical protein